MMDPAKTRTQAELLKDDIDSTASKAEEAQRQIRDKLADVTGAANRQVEEIRKSASAAVDQTTAKASEIKDQMRETVANVSSTVNRQASDIERDVAGMAGSVSSTVAGLDRTTLALASAAAAVLVTLGVSMIRDRIAAGQVSPLQRHGQTLLRYGQAEASKASTAAGQTARSAAQQLEYKLADQLEDVARQLRGQSGLRRISVMGGGLSMAMVIGAVLAVLVAIFGSGRRVS